MSDKFKQIAHKADKMLASMTQAEKDTILEKHRLTDRSIQEDIFLSMLNHNHLLTEALLEAHAEIENLTSLHPIDEWHEDHGTVVWWSTDDDAVVIPDYIGSPLDSDWPSDDNYKWWSHLKISKGGP